MEGGALRGPQPLTDNAEAEAQPGPERLTNNDQAEARAHLERLTNNGEAEASAVSGRVGHSRHARSLEQVPPTPHFTPTQMLKCSTCSYSRVFDE